MKSIRVRAIVGIALATAACSDRCETLTRGEALKMATEEKAGMLRRSTAEYAANYRSDEPVFVRIGAETNGYAANVGWRGGDGTTLVALIEGDCYIGWTSFDR